MLISGTSDSRWKKWLRLPRYGKSVNVIQVPIVYPVLLRNLSGRQLLTLPRKPG